MRAKRTALRKNEFSPFTFAQISDSHLLASGTEWDARVEKIINTIQAREPSVEFILHTGDLVDAASKEAVQAFRTKFSANKLPLHVVPGNHDVWNARVSGEGAPWWTRTTTTTDQQQFRQWFGATCYSVMYRDCAFVAFNSQLMNTALTEEQEQWEWLEAELQRLDELNAVHIVLFTHMPLFVRTPDEQLD